MDGNYIRIKKLKKKSLNKLQLHSLHFNIFQGMKSLHNKTDFKICKSTKVKFQNKTPTQKKEDNHFETEQMRVLFKSTIKNKFYLSQRRY